MFKGDKSDQIRERESEAIAKIKIQLSDK